MRPISPLSIGLGAHMVRYAIAAPAKATNSSTSVNVAGTCPGEAGIPLEAFISYSIEFSSFVDFAGNPTTPNTFSNNLLNNLGNLTGTKPYIRVGGNTQDYAMFNASLDTAIVGIFVPSISSDYPRYVTIGPAFYDSFHTWPDTKFIYGFDLAANGTDGRESLLATAQYACQSLGTDLLAYWELGNEPDLYTTSSQGARRPPTWNEQDYVDEWLNGSRAIKQTIQQYCPNLATNEAYKYYAPSFAGTNNHLDPLSTWEDDLDADDDVAIITSHNYIGGATQPGVTLQGTLMNHSSTVASVAKQLNESHLLSQLSPSLDPGLPFILGETNSLYNEGAPGLSNSFGAALWGVDFALYCAANNISRIHFHQGTNYRYQSWQPIQTNTTTQGTKAPYYGNIASAAFVGNITESVPSIVNIPLPAEREAAYAAYVDNVLKRVMVINLQEYNSTENYTDKYPRPIYKYDIEVPSSCNKHVGLQRLMANGSDAVSGITFDGYSYNYELDNGQPVLLNNVTRGETVHIRNGRAKVNVPASSAVILNLEC